MKRSGRKRRERKAQRAAAKPAMSPPKSPDENAGGFGGTHAGPVAEAIPHGNEELIRNQRIEARALREEWPIKEQYREPLANGQVMIALDPKREPRDRTRAFMALLAANKQNMDARKPDSDKSPSVTVNVGLQVNQAVQAAVGSEPEYLDWIRQRELAEGGDTHAVGPNGFAAKVPHAASRLGNGQSGNGHH
jgi:hypothetical protein